MERTSVIQGTTPVLLVAPHGPDDENTAELTELVAKHFGAYAVINRGWQRSSRVDQFRDLANCNDVRHLHQDVVREEFLHPILRCVTRIKKKYEGKALVLVIHGCKDQIRHGLDDEMLDIVVGYGAGNPPFYSCRTRTKNAFVRCLQDEGFGVYEGAAGGLYAGRAKNNLNQLFVRWYADNAVESMQIEIVRELREDREMLSLTAEGLMTALDSFMLIDESDEVEEIRVGKI
jgi:hypothetical protein